MANSKKEAIVLALCNYMEIKGLTQEDISRLSGINISYINSMVNGSDRVGKTAIKDSYYRKVSKAIGLNDTAYWLHVDTPQYSDITTELLDAKVRGLEKMIIGETGCGKTYAVRMFKQKHPANTYVITVSGLHKLGHILGDICEAMGIQHVPDNMSKLRKISSRLRSLKLDGRKPVIIIDEAENLKLPALKMTKALYDYLEGYCPIVLIGTPQLLRKIERFKEADEEGMAQLYRRFKAGKRELRGIDKDAMFEPFFEGIEDNGVRTLVYTLADNYGELNRYLEPALREADQMGEVLSENFYRMLYRI